MKRKNFLPNFGEQQREKIAKIEEETVYVLLLADQR